MIERETNPHKRLAQLEKRDDLCLHIEQHCNDVGLHLFDNAQDIVDMLECWSDVIWARVAASCRPEHDPPSDEVIELVTARFRSRGEDGTGAVRARGQRRMEEALMSLAVLAKKPFVLPSSLSPVERLVGAIDELMRESGKDPDDSAAAIAVLVGDLWGPELWTRTAVSIGLPPPDDETRAHVVRTYIRRGMARRADEERS